MNTDEAVGLFSAFVLVCLVIAAGIGWVLNIVALAQASGITGMVLLRVAGIFIPPLGGVLGYV